jgi:hypothetical protein
MRLTQELSTSISTLKREITPKESLTGQMVPHNNHQRQKQLQATTTQRRTTRDMSQQITEASTRQ